jgi:hypothetical protein
VYTTLEMIPRSFVTPRNECNYLSGCAIKRKNLLIFAENCDVLEAMLRQLVTRFIACWSRKIAEKWCKDDFVVGGMGA